MADRPPRPGVDPGFPPPWGPREVLLGLVGALSLAILLVFVLAGAGALLGLPQESVVLRYVLFAASEGCLLLVVAAAVFLAGGDPAVLGVRPPARPLPATGEALATGAVLVLLSRGWELALARWAPLLHARLLAEERAQLEFLAAPWPLLVVAAVVAAPLAEELFFRGFVFGGLRGRLGFPLASGLSALLFALVHVMPASAPPLFAVGLATATLCERHRSLVPALVAHATYNGIGLAAWFLGWQ